MSENTPQTSVGGDCCHFPPTRWTVLEDKDQRRKVIDELSERYWKPLYAYLRARGWSNDQAKDLVQGFFTEKVLGQDLVKRADRAKGRFRNFLLVTLRNYAINESNKKQNRKLLSLDCVSGTISDDGPDLLFDRLWAESLLERIQNELMIEYSRKGESSHWALFQAWIRGHEDTSRKMVMRDMCAQQDIPNANLGYKIIARIKARFGERLREHLLAQGVQSSEIQSEIGRFIELFSNRRGNQSNSHCTYQ